MADCWSLPHDYEPGAELTASVLYVLPQTDFQAQYKPTYLTLKNVTDFLVPKINIGEIFQAIVSFDFCFSVKVWFVIGKAKQIWVLNWAFDILSQSVYLPVAQVRAINQSFFFPILYALHGHSLRPISPILGSSSGLNTFQKVSQPQPSNLKTYAKKEKVFSILFYVKYTIFLSGLLSLLYLLS